MCPNFERLKDIENQFLRTALYTATGDERDRLEKAFPEYYVATIDEVRVPASILRIRTRERLLSEGETNDDDTKFYTEVCWSTELGLLDVPVREWNEGTEPLPDEIWSQLAGQELRSGIEVEYMEQKFLLVYYLDLDGPSMLLGNRLPVTRATQKRAIFTFVHSKFIDLNS